MQVVPFLDGDAEDVVDAQFLEPVDGQRGLQVGQQHVVFVESVPDVLGHGALGFPLQCKRKEVLGHERPASFLEVEMCLLEVWRGEAAEIGWICERAEIRCCVGHGVLYVLWYVPIDQD
jgi:hypothetical protein